MQKLQNRFDLSRRSLQIGLFTLAGILLGLAFPFEALGLARYGAFALFLLALFSGFTVEWDSILLRRPALSDVAFLFTLNVFLPLLQLAVAQHFVKDQHHLLGLLFISLCPVAIVAPIFVAEAGGDAGLSLYRVILSTLISPLVVWAGLFFFLRSGTRLDLGPMIRSVFLVTALPLILSATFAKIPGKWRTTARRMVAPLNPWLMGLLVFIFFGSSAGQLNLELPGAAELAAIGGLCLFQDFGVYLLSRRFLKTALGAGEELSWSLSLSMKNIAVAAGVLLFFDPRAALAASICFVAHGAFFLWAGLHRPATTAI